MKKISNTEMIKLINTANKTKSSIVHITDKTKLSHEEKMKLGLCTHFVRFMHKKRILLKDLAELIDLPKSRVSEIINYKINKFSIEKLLHNLELLSKHDANIKAYLDILTTTTEIPIPKAATSRRLVKEIREVSASL